MTHLKKQQHLENDTVTPVQNDLLKLLTKHRNQDNENNANSEPNREQELPVRSSARIRDDNYHHSAVNIRK